MSLRNSGDRDKTRDEFYKKTLGITDKGERDTTARNLRGVKYSHYGSKSREGIASMLDEGIVNRRMQTEAENYGGGSVTMYLQRGKNGQYNPINIGGRLHYPSDDGKITICDGALLEKERELENERRQYLASVIDMLSTSDAVCSLGLGVDCATILGKGQDGGIKMDDDLKNTDAKPSSIESYAIDSITYSRAIQKFKLIVGSDKYLPIIQNMTPASIQNEGVEPVK